LLSKTINIKIYRTTILNVFLYVCETLSLTWREERSLGRFDNRELRRISGPMSDKMTRERRRLHNQELYALYTFPNISRAIKSRRLTWAGHVARMGEREVHTGFWCENLREENHLEDLGVDGRIILKIIFEKWFGGEAWT
jgi:hypothetical protein